MTALVHNTKKKVELSPSFLHVVFLLLLLLFLEWSFFFLVSFFFICG